MNTAAAPKYCPGCGTRLHGDERHCRECGTRVAPAAVGASAPPPSAALPPTAPRPPAPQAAIPHPPAASRPQPTVPSGVRPPQSPPPSRPSPTDGERRRAGAWAGLLAGLAVAAAGGLSQVDWSKHRSFLGGLRARDVDGTYVGSSNGLNLIVTLDGERGDIAIGPYRDQRMRVERHGDTLTMSGGTIVDAEGRTVDASARNLLTGGDETNVFTLTDDGQTLTSRDTDAHGNRLVFNKQP